MSKNVVELPRMVEIKEGVSFDVQTIEQLMVNGRFREDPIRHPCFEVIWIMKGEGSISIDMETYPVEVDTFYFIPAGHRVRG